MIVADRNTIIQVLGSLMNKPELLSDTDKYLLEPMDFSQQLDRFIFSAIYNLYVGGAEKIHTVDIDNYLNSNVLAKELIEKENGLQFLQDCEEYGDYSNFSYYYNKLKKINLLRDLSKNNYDISDFYCEDPLSDNYYAINEKFENMTINDILNKIKGTYVNLESKYAFNTVVEESSPADDIEELIEELKIKPEVGVRLQGEIYNTIVRGGRKKTVYLRSASSGIGKALPNYTKIPTPVGWKTVGEIKIGDYLFDRNGNPTKVINVFPQGKKQIYKIYFKSGKVAECCKEHLWSYYSNKNDKKPNTLITTTLEELINNKKGLRDRLGGYRWSIPINKPLNYKEKQYSVPPYIMGLILGDGSFRYTSEQKGFFFSSKDIELVKAIQEQMGYAEYRKNSEFNHNWSFKYNNNNKHSNVWVEEILKDYSELWNTKSETKFIPQDYLFGSIQQRYDLLAGLLDTDGHIDEKGRVSYSTVSPFLRDNVVELCESLGLIATSMTDKRNKYTTGECYTIHIQGSKEDKIKFFKLERKLNIAKQYVNNNKRTERKDRDSIIKIEETDKYTEMTCFLVDNEEHLFLMNNCICTHNSRMAVGDACYIAYPIRFEPKYNRWISTGQTEKVLYVMTEQDRKEIQTMILAYLTGINEEYFKLGNFLPEHEPRIKKAIEIMKRYKDNLLFARIPEPTPSIIKNLFRRYNLQYGVNNFFFDYIFSNEAMLSEYRDLKLPEHVCLRLFTTALKNLAIELDSFICTSTQISEQENDKKSSWKDYHNIAGARAIVHLVDVGCIVSRPTQEELKLLEGFIQTYGITPNFVTDFYKNRGGRWTMVRVWSVHDLGTCRKHDLFVTTPDLRPIENFQVVDFIQEKTKEMYELEKEFNDGQSSNNDDELLSILDESPLENVELENKIEQAFGNIHEHKARIVDKSFEELL